MYEVFAPIVGLLRWCVRQMKQKIGWPGCCTLGAEHGKPRFCLLIAVLFPEH